MSDKGSSGAQQPLGCWVEEAMWSVSAAAACRHTAPLLPVWDDVVEQQHVSRLHLHSDKVAAEVNTQLTHSSSLIHTQVPAVREWCGVSLYDGGKCAGVVLMVLEGSNQCGCAMLQRYLSAASPPSLPPPHHVSPTAPVCCTVLPAL